jgi:hypothetical protein
MNAESISCDHIGHSYDMAPKAAQVKLSEFLFAVAKLVKLYHELFIVLLCWFERFSGWLKLNVGSLAEDPKIFEPAIGS